MKIGIVGAGFTGLSAAYYLQKSGHYVTVLERGAEPGGLAIGYKEHEWDWTLEEHYHHWFTNDTSVLSLAKEIAHPVIIKRPKTSSFVGNQIYQLDSPTSLLKFPQLNLVDKVRTGIAIALLRYNPFWKLYEKYTAEPYLKGMMGRTAYRKIWEPLMKNKLGKYAESVSLAWFWARVYKRTGDLAYPQGGFLHFSKHLEKKIKEKKGEFYYNAEVLQITSGEKASVTFSYNNKKQTKSFDKIIVTLPISIFSRIAPELPKTYIETYSKLQGIGAVNIVLRLKENFFKDQTYWLNMCDNASPILAIVEHTNFMNKKYYNNESLIYIGNYMETSDPRFSMTASELMKLYDPWLKKINPTYKSNVISYKLFKAPFAQPIVPINYSKKIPSFKTPLKNVYLANIQQVYPWDRGTNYAVELGKNISKLIDNEI